MREDKVAVIGGTGDLGLGLALRWARAGVPVLIGSRDEKKAQDAAAQVRAKLNTDLLPELAPQPVCRRAGERAGSGPGVDRRVGSSVLGAGGHSEEHPLRVEGFSSGGCNSSAGCGAVGGRATRLVGVWQGSAAEQARELIPAETPVVAAFHTVSAEALQELATPLEGDVVLPQSAVVGSSVISSRGKI